jgi:mono/diheme cytochrome c family protein
LFFPNRRSGILSPSPGLGVQLKFSGMALAFALVAGSAAGQDARRGEYIAALGGCVACHTEDKKGAVPFAGGRALKTPFGTFFGPNITPHPEAGIGRWTVANFFQAMRLGERPDGSHYFPAFPYPSFTRIGEKDLRDLWAYLRKLPPSPRVNQPHELKFPFNVRLLVAGWKLLFFNPGTFEIDPKKAPQVNLGAYIVQALSHCGECHTPRNLLGGPRRDRMLAGGKGPDGKDLPNLTPANLKKWSDAELKEFLQTGITPDMDSANSTMQEVIDNTLSKMSAVDLNALVAYLRSLPPLPDEKSDKK